MLKVGRYVFWIFGISMFDKYSQIEEKYRKDKSPRKNREMGNVDESWSETNSGHCV